MASSYPTFLNTVYDHLQNANRSLDQVANMSSGENVPQLLRFALNFQSRKQKQACEIEKLLGYYERKKAAKKRSLVEQSISEHETKRIKLEESKVMQILPENEQNLQKLIQEISQKEKSLTLISISLIPNTKLVTLNLNLSSTLIASILLDASGYNFDINTTAATSYTIISVKFYGRNEKDLLKDNKTTNHRIFIKMNSHVAEALEYYKSHETYSKFTLQAILCYILSYEKLFVEKCTGCNKLLKMDSSQFGFLPPSVRTFQTFKVYHAPCATNKHL